MEWFDTSKWLQDFDSPKEYKDYQRKVASVMYEDLYHKPITDRLTYEITDEKEEAKMTEYYNKEQEFLKSKPTNDTTNTQSSWNQEEGTTGEESKPSVEWWKWEWV